MISDKRLRMLYRAMLTEQRGPETTNFILALMSRVDELKLEIDILRLAANQPPSSVPDSQ